MVNTAPFQLAREKDLRLRLDQHGVAQLPREVFWKA
jgi:hypothetical protein